MLLRRLQRRLRILAPGMWAFGALAASCAGPRVGSGGVAVDSSYELVPASEVEYTKLNPARGDASPRAGTLWGDRAGTAATGFLFRPADGFESPPHVHNVTYRGVVIRGDVHNAHPRAPHAWMPPGSFWTQPKGQVHITAARGEDTLAYIEIDSGPYLVWPVEDGFPGPERPINVDATNLVWASVDAPLDPSADGPRCALLWADGDRRGVMLRIPADGSITLRSPGGAVRGVVVEGSPRYGASSEPTSATVQPGSCFSSVGPAVHRVRASAGEPCALYLRVEGTIAIDG